MAYKTLFTTVTDPAAAEAPLNVATALCRAWDAHLDVLTMGIDRTQTGYYYAGANAMVLQETLQRAQAEANDLEAQIRAKLEPEDLRWNVETAVAAIADLVTV